MFEMIFIKLFKLLFKTLRTLCMAHTKKYSNRKMCKEQINVVRVEHIEHINHQTNVGRNTQHPAIQKKMAETHK